MPRIGFLGCAETLPGSPRRRADAFEHDLQVAAFRDGIAGRAEVVALDWAGALDPLLRCDLVLLGSAWDYTERLAEFLTRLQMLEAEGVRVCNPSQVVRWNADKRYLADLAQAGAPSIPTMWHDDPGEGAIRAAFDHFGCDRVVVKRRVGAGALGQFSFTRDDPALPGWRMGHAAMIQPFLPAIMAEGEMSQIFIDGRFSHALMKCAAQGDYRIQSLYGGIEVPLKPLAVDIARGEAVLAMLPFAQPPLYARIDMVRGHDGELALIEAELIEPYLYPEQDAQFGARLANAALARLT